jgi:tubulin-specific chaperone D
VRDAACYTIYSIVRTVPPTSAESLEPWLLEIAVRLACVATLDPSTTIRRAASAAYQELVGRQSPSNDRVPEGIAVLSMMDYHAVGSRRGGFEAAGKVASIDRRYRAGIIEWCISRGVSHWEQKGREGVAKVLGKVFISDKEDVIDVLRLLVCLHLL